MVINDQYHFIFVHVPKAAGTSLTTTLRTLPGNEVVTTHPTTKHETVSEWHARTSGDARAQRLRDGALENYLTFGFVRHPWDRMSSLYHYLRDVRPREEIDTIRSFADFLEQARDGVAWIRGLHSLRPQGEFFAGAPTRRLFIGHFEHLTDDFAAVAAATGIDVPVPHANASAHRGRDYRADYTPALADIVATLFAADIARFQYRFDERRPLMRANRHALTFYT